MNLAKLFGSKCRARILERFLLDAEAASPNAQPNAFGIRELAREVGEQLNSVRRELTNLESLGLLVSRSDANRKAYCLVRSSALAEPLRQMFLDSYAPIESLSHFFSSRSDISLVAYAKHLERIATVERGGSAIVDILVIGDIAKSDLSVQVEKTFFGRKVKYATLSPDEFVKRLEYSDKLILSILSHKDMVMLKDTIGARAMIERSSL